MLHEFTMCVEPVHDGGFEREITFEGTFIPHVIYIGDKAYYRVGRYASPGERFRYNLATVMHLED